MKKILTIVLTVCAMMTAAEAAGQPLVKTHVETGDVEGILDGTLAVYKAIPYAAPPVGELRWREPQPAKAWEGTLKTENFGPLPPQPTRPGRTADMMSEDCLYLGIATPAKSASERLPVMVWIHGGGFQTEWYGGDLWRHLAMRGVVVVSVEYRNEQSRHIRLYTKWDTAAPLQQIIELLNGFEKVSVRLIDNQIIAE